MEPTRSTPEHRNPLRRKAFIIIFGTDTSEGRLFDIALLVLILISVLLVVLESIPSVNQNFGRSLRTAEWVVTIAFTLEYAARIWVVNKPKAYIFSFFGLVDLLSIVPSYLSLFVAGTQSLAILRAIRLLRVFRVLKLAQFVEEARALSKAIGNARRKILVFFTAVLILVFIMGSLMYFIEGPEHGFVSIPVSVYWAIVTLTTVGFGDITPGTDLGRFVASIIMLLGYSIIAIPTGIVGAELYRGVQGARGAFAKWCTVCQCAEDRSDAHYCRRCGEPLIDRQS